jgi:hypothetical protein
MENKMIAYKNLLFFGIDKIISLTPFKIGMEISGSENQDN